MMENDVNRSDGGAPATSRLAAEGMLLVVTIIWGGTFAATSELIGSGLDPEPRILWRFGSAAILLLPFLLLARGRRFDRTTVVVGLVLGLLLYIGFILQTIGLVTTSSSRSGFITALYVVITPLLQPLFGRPAPSLGVWLSVLLIVVGLWLLIEPGGSGGVTLGDVQTFLCAISFALFIIVLDRYGRRTEVLGLTWIQMLVVALCALLHMTITGSWSRPAEHLIPSGTTPWLLLGYLAVCGTLFTMWGQNRFQPWTTPSRAAIIFTMESVFAALIGVFLLKEALGLAGALGGFLIVAGLLLVELRPGFLRKKEDSADGKQADEAE